MRQHRFAAESRIGVILTLAVAAALVFAPVTPAAAPPVPWPEQPAPGPLFAPEELHVNPTHLSLALFGSSFTPGLGPISATAILKAGHKLEAWNLDGAMTNRYSRISVGVSTLVMNGFAGNTSPLLDLASLQQGEQLNCWLLIDTDRFRPIPKEWWLVVQDSRGLFVGNPESLTYSRVLARALYTSPQAFASVTRRDITFTHLFQDPERYRGVVVHVEGRLLRINRYEPPPEATEAGVTDLYEAWIFNEQFGASPYVVVFPAWPKDLSRELLGKGKIGNGQRDQQVRVKVDAYFFKKFRYRDQKGDRDTPLLIGHTLELSTGPPGAHRRIGSQVGSRMKGRGIGEKA